jgi:hypothetical protein
MEPTRDSVIVISNVPGISKHEKVLLLISLFISSLSIGFLAGVLIISKIGVENITIFLNRVQSMTSYLFEMLKSITIPKIEVKIPSMAEIRSNDHVVIAFMSLFGVTNKYIFRFVVIFLLVITFLKVAALTNFVFDRWI